MRKRIIGSLLLSSCISLPAFAGNITYNVFLIPAKTVDQTVKNVSERLSRHQLDSLYKKGYLPHVTLYLTEYPEGSLAAIEKQAKQLAGHWHSFSLTLDELQRTKGDWLMLDVENSRDLQRLADQATLAMEPLRATNPQLPSWVSQYPNKLESFKRYGSPNVFANFQPHITLLPKSDSIKLDSFMNSYGASFKPIKTEVIGIGIAEVNKNGQARKDLASYYFQK
ncbi:2'-5' RNA ligase family protein [Vibrio profundum]|uniref:2'-5' RNA ligase family protein n=1 Tax=Vibrio profundum TaxID=2910247 RepID=UPI003D1118BB